MAQELIPQEIHASPAAIRATVNDTRPAASQAAEQMRARHPRRIYLIGNGTSLYSSMAASYTARALAGGDDPLVIAWPAGDFRYFTPQLTERDVVVGVSASGEFRDVLAVFETIRERCLCVGITHIPGSTITRLAHATLISSGGPSNMPVMTKTYASTLTAAHLLLLEYFQAGGDYTADLLASADRCEEALAKAEPQMAEMVSQLAKFEHAFYFGAGNAYAAALETALKMKEMAILHAEGSETWEMASGPATRVGQDTFCVGLTDGDSTDTATADGIRHAREWGARVLEVGPNAVAGDLHFPVAAPRFTCFASLALVPPLALLAFRVARARGANPDRPAWRERYLSQGMSHILGE